jgi:hypothetical protein
LVADYRGLTIRDKNGHQLSFQKKKKGEKKRRREGDAKVRGCHGWMINW